MAIEPDFHQLAPLAVAESNILSGPPDAENQVFDVGDRPYADGARVWDSGKTYLSLVATNNAALTDAASWEDQGDVDEGALKWVAGTYALDVYKVHNSALWKSSEDSNSDEPTDASTKWTRQGATNRHKAFDGFLQDVAEQTGGLIYLMNFSELVTDIAILRGSGVTVQITMTDATEGLVYDETLDLQDDSGIIDAWEYCFGPFILNDTVLFEDLPPYAGADIMIKITGVSTSVAQILFGVGLPLGMVKVGTGVGIESYSLKERDAFNRSIVVPRPYSDTVDFDLVIATLQVGYVKRRLAEREALPTLYYMSGGGPYGTVVYGFFQTFDILHDTPTTADCVLEIEGLG